MHLVNYTTEFTATNGNFYIDANFVAMTFAPLTDVLFRYVVNFPLIDNPISINSNTNEPPKNTYEFIKKLENLYSAGVESINNDVDNKEYKKTIESIEKKNLLIGILRNFINNEGLKEIGNPYLLVKNDFDDASGKKDGNKLTKLNNLGEYDNIIKGESTTGRPSSIKNKLYIVTYFGDYDDNVILSDTDKSRLKKAIETYTTYRRGLIVDAASNSNKSESEYEDEIVSAIDFDCKYDVNTSADKTKKNAKYVGIDVTDYYLNLYYGIIEDGRKKSELLRSVNDKMNNTVWKNLGMLPTIYNVFNIILHDVDTFFSILRDASLKAENHHSVTDAKSVIKGENYKDFNGDKIYAFPQFVETYNQNNNIKKERIAPINISNQMSPNIFPEIKLIDDFIKTFQKQQVVSNLLNKKSEMGENGYNIWMPISPIDAAKYGGKTKDSPYINIDPYGNVISTSEKSAMNSAIEILIKRFYALSQATIPTTFYDSEESTDKTNLIKMFAQAEAINLAISLHSTSLCDNFKKNADDWGLTVDNFYQYLSDVQNEIFVYNKNYVDVSNSCKIYINKENTNYEGLEFTDSEIKLQIENPSKPLAEFSNINKSKIYQFFKNTDIQNNYKFTDDNLFYASDVTEQKTKFIAPTVLAYFDSKLQELLNGGNAITSKSGINPQYTHVPTWWKTELSLIMGDPNISGVTEYLISNNSIGNLILLSNFGLALSPFNTDHNINGAIFKIPALVEMPAYLPAYLGLLININEDVELYNEVYDFYATGYGYEIGQGGYRIFADLHDVNMLSLNDKKKLQTEYENFIDNNIKGINIAMSKLIDKVKTGETLDNLFEVPANTNNIFNPLLQPTVLVNYGENTFKLGDYTIPSAYTSLKDLNVNGVNKNINDAFFIEFFTQLSKNIDIVKNAEDKNTNLSHDKDIITQMYYSLKNINDKWLTNPNNDPNNTGGYPFNPKGKNLIDSFAFVDRAMCPIGDTIINCQMLIDLLNDPNATLYTVISQLLSANGFEFFPLQNFMSFIDVSTNKDNIEQIKYDWEKSFKIDTSGICDSVPAFVCMYIGGTSSYPSGVGNNNNGFVDDSVDDIMSPDLTDFHSSASNVINENDKQEINNTKFPYRQVRAFRVRFGEQNQSMFTGFGVDSKEYPETNESIQILSSLAGDNKSQSVPKAQNLYNLYENRSYKATIESMGNMMLQPTQYFQLENIPVFNGVYIILDVEHIITANKMMTTFSGTKILKYPIPRVTSPAAIFGFEGGDTDDTSLDQSYDKVTMGVGTAANPEQAKYNAMYTLKI
jgi:hypothetical protein